jgi:hypothetical protein
MRNLKRAHPGKFDERDQPCGAHPMTCSTSTPPLSHNRFRRNRHQRRSTTPRRRGGAGRCPDLSMTRRIRDCRRCGRGGRQTRP